MIDKKLYVLGFLIWSLNSYFNFFGGGGGILNDIWDVFWKKFINFYVLKFLNCFDWYICILSLDFRIGRILWKISWKREMVIVVIILL